MKTLITIFATILVYALLYLGWTHDDMFAHVGDLNPCQGGQP